MNIKRQEAPSLDLGYKQIIKLSLPTVVAHFAILLIGIADLYFIGKFGAQAITAVAIGVSVWWAIAYFFDGLRSAMVVLVANSLGKMDTLAITKLLNSGLFLALVSGFIFLLLSTPIANVICSNISDDPEVVRMSSEFLQYLLPTAPFCFVMFVAEGFFRGLCNVRIPMIIAITVTATSIFLDWVFIAGNLGFTSMGVKGAAMATAIAHIIGGILGFTFIVMNKESRSYFLPDAGAQRHLVQYAKVAFDTGTYSGLLQVALIGFTALLKNVGTTAQAANQIANEVFNISFLPPMGYMVTASILTSMLVGRNQQQLVFSTVKRILFISLGSVSVMSVFSYIFADQVAHFFSPIDHAVATLAAQAIKIAAINQVLCAISLVLRGALIGLGYTVFVRYCGIISSFFFFLPTAYIFVNVLGYGLNGGYIALTLWTAFVLALFLPVFWLHTNKVASNHQTNKA